MNEQDPGVVDTTLSQVSLSVSDPSVVLAAAVAFGKAVRELGIAALEIGHLSDPIRFELAHRLGSHIPGLSIIAWSEPDRLDITHACEALKACRQPRVGLVLPISPEVAHGGHWQSYTLLLERVAGLVRHARAQGAEVDLVINDAMTPDPAFLERVAEAAGTAGATGIIVCESGQMTVDPFARLIQRLAATCPQMRVGVRCRRRHGAGTELTLAALEQGATEIGTVITEFTSTPACPALDKLTILGALAYPLDLIAPAAATLGALIGTVCTSTWHAAASSMRPSIVRMPGGAGDVHGA